MSRLTRLLAVATASVALAGGVLAQEAETTADEAFGNCLVTEFVKAYPAMLRSGHAFAQAQPKPENITKEAVLQHLDQMFSQQILEDCGQQTGASAQTVEQGRQFLDELYKKLAL